MPNPEEQFILEIDALDIGAGVVLFQRAPDGKVHPCAYISCRLSPAERNYAVGDQELLALKLALEQWRHLLEGSTVPLFGRITGTWSTSGRRSASTPGRLVISSI